MTIRIDLITAFLLAILFTATLYALFLTLRDEYRKDTMLTTMRINLEQLQAAFAEWEQEARDGKTMTRDQTMAMPVDQVAAEAAEYLWQKLSEHSA